MNKLGMIGLVEVPIGQEVYPTEFGYGHEILSERVRCVEMPEHHTCKQCANYDWCDHCISCYEALPFCCEAEWRTDKTNTYFVRV